MNESTDYTALKQAVKRREAEIVAGYDELREQSRKLSQMKERPNEMGLNIGKQEARNER